ncbi:hypothetical protein [Streptomyces sp. NPDC059970]|uniref:hypothetical protein n=1 Tax=Streptomyces sp. NPDC059970 TaxID=3347019 RepID=UPI00369987AC
MRGSDGQVYFRAPDVAALLRSIAASWDDSAVGDAPAWAPTGGDVTLLDAGTVRTLADVLRVQADEIDLQSIALTSNGVEVGPDSTPAPKPPNPVGTEKAVSLLLSDPGVQEVRARVEAAETELGMELQAHLRPFQDRYDQAVRDGDAVRLTGVCPGKHGRWGRICVLPAGHETSMEEPHWGRNSEGRPIAWVGSAPDDW